MLSKENLRKDFSSDYQKYYMVETFKREGFSRKQCKGCGKFFWTSSSKEYCGDPEHEPYSFIRDKQNDIGYVEFWDKFAHFFKKNGHAIVERYPVVSRWRQDLYFTIAGIQDFQRIENGKMEFEYQANPLLVPQMCMRFNDLPNVGITGRHFTSFMMANQTSFNYPREGYWRDRTIELNYDFLVNTMGVKKDDLTYVEDVWSMGDFSEFGPSLEAYSNGLELVNNVFTQFEYTNNTVRELSGKVVDVGWGFERLLWFYSHKETAFDATFPRILEYIHKNCGLKQDRKLYRKVGEVAGGIDIGEAADISKYSEELARRAGISIKEYNDIIRPMQAAYAIADHSRTLMFGINDGALPSNVGGGYNLRIILRRMFDLIDEYGMSVDPIKLIEMHASELKGLYGPMLEDRDELNEIIELERKRYVNTKQAASSTVASLLSNNEAISVERLKTLYESNGITPEYIAKVAASKGVKVKVPENFYSKVIKGDFTEKRKHGKSLDIDVDGLPQTEKLFYKFESEADAKVLRLKGNMAVLDKTPFYAESGGQEADHGTIGNVRVIDVQGLNGVIVHVFDGKPDFSEGSTVHCIVDQERRTRLMAHHTATHLMSAAARKVLGEHAWQEGARKSATKAHIDVAHYERLSDEEVQRIEDTANGYIVHGMKVKMEEVPRSEAETKFGFSIYQGHGVPAKMLRMVEIYDKDGKLIDAEACGGLHLMDRESMVGLIKVVSSSRIHDGVNRLEYVAGPASVEYVDTLGRDLRSIASVVGVDKDKLIQGVSMQMNELKEFRKEQQRLIDELAELMAREFAVKGGELKRRMDYGRLALRAIATKMADSRKGSVVLLYNGSGELICVSSDPSRSAVEFAKSSAGSIAAGASFIGGGTARMAEGKLSNA